MSSIVDADTLLAVDVGSVHTRASLFDVVEGRYRLVAAGRAPTTAGPPLFDVREGVRSALDQIHEITGRLLVDAEENLITPVNSDGAGVDVFVATSSAGPRVRAVLVGLMPGVSLESGRRLAESTYLQIVEEIGLLDRRPEDEQIDRMLAAKPDLFLLVGGTDGGATESVMRMVDLVSLTTSLIPDGRRPLVVYAGNRHLGADVVERFGDPVPVALTPNIRPSLTREDLAPTRLRLAEAIAEARSAQVAGFDELTGWSGGFQMLSADAFGRIVRYLSLIYDPEKGVLGIDVGGVHTIVAAAFAGDLRLSVQSALGLGSSLPGILRTSSLDEIARWLPVDLSHDTIRDYIFNKALHPRSVPTELDEFHLEYALLREILRTAVGIARSGWAGRDSGQSILLPSFEPIVAAGGALSRAPQPGHAALALLDAIQPVGITTLVLDPHGIAPALGAASGPLPMSTIQVLSSGSFVSLGTVVAPVGRGRVGRPALRLRLERESGRRGVEGEVRFGQLAVVPLHQGEHAKLTLQPERGFDVGFGGPGKAGALRVAGGAVGLIFDARGRPLQLSSDPERRRELNQKWLWDIGGME